MRTSVVFLLISVLACTTTGQDPAPSQPAPYLKPIAVASIHVDKHRFKSGERIEVTILLEAGPYGVYVPKWWGTSGGGMAGFSVHLATLSGRGGAETCGLAGDAWPTHEPNAKVALNRDFIYLPGQQLIGLKTLIVCPTSRPGKYLINGSYSPYHIDADRIAQLPETRGLVLREAVKATPVAITIY
jgi:hypothetical protein